MLARTIMGGSVAISFESCWISLENANPLKEYSSAAAITIVAKYTR